MDNAAQSETAVNLMHTPWFLVVVVGAIVLAAALAYGMAQTRRRTRAEKARTAEATTELYRRENEDNRV